MKMKVRGEAIADLVRVRALTFPLERVEGIRGLRVPRAGVVEEKHKR